MNYSLLTHKFIRPALAAALLAAFPLTGVSSAVSPEPTRAATATPTPAVTVTAPDATPVPTDATKLSTALQAQHLATLKTRGDAEITRRLTNLNAAMSKISGLGTLSASDKAALTSQVQTEITGLTALKTKLDADTTLDTARSDVQSIITEYRVYLLMLPKVHLVAAADRLTAAATQLTILEAKLQTAVDAQKTAGKNVTAMQTSLSDMQAKIAAMQAAISGITAKLLALQPSDYNTDHAVLAQYRAALGTAASDAKAAAADAQSLITALAASASPSASPTAK